MSGFKAFKGIQRLKSEHEIANDNSTEIIEQEMVEEDNKEKVRTHNRTTWPVHVTNDGREIVYCFVAGTLVMTDIGLTSIEEIKENDLVQSYNLIEKTIELKPVVRTFINKSKEIYNVYVNGQKIEVTGGHLFFVNNDWLHVRDIKVNDELIDSNNNKMTVEKIEIVELTEEINVYNFEVKDNHNYFVTNQNILVHNESELQW